MSPRRVPGLLPHQWLLRHHRLLRRWRVLPVFHSAGLPHLSVRGLLPGWPTTSRGHTGRFSGIASLLGLYLSWGFGFRVTAMPGGPPCCSASASTQPALGSRFWRPLWGCRFDERPLSRWNATAAVCAKYRVQVADLTLQLNPMVVIIDHSRWRVCVFNHVRRFARGAISRCNDDSRA